MAFPLQDAGRTQARCPWHTMSCSIKDSYLRTCCSQKDAEIRTDLLSATATICRVLCTLATSSRINLAVHGTLGSPSTPLKTERDAEEVSIFKYFSH